MQFLFFCTLFLSLVIAAKVFRVEPKHKVLVINDALEARGNPGSLSDREKERQNNLSYLFSDVRGRNVHKLLYQDKAEEINEYWTGFFECVVQAYNNHRSVEFDPDTLYITIVSQFSIFVNDNAEALRDLFVDFQGKKEISITSEKETGQDQWDEFFAGVIVGIQDNVKDGLAQRLTCDFSTTGRMERIVSISTVMDTFKSYFDYARLIPLCGLRAAYFTGQEADWVKLIELVKALKGKYLVAGDKSWERYIDNLLPTLEKLLEAYHGTLDIDFWNKIINIRHGPPGSGSTTSYSGWINTFYIGMTGREADSRPPRHLATVPVKFTDKLRGEVKDLLMKAGFVGIRYEAEGDFYKPVLGIAIADVTENKEKECETVDWP